MGSQSVCQGAPWGVTSRSLASALHQHLGMKPNINFNVNHKPTWILVASRSHAKIFEPVDRGEDLRVVADFPHPEGRLKDREINTDRPGRQFDLSNQSRHTTGAASLPTEQIAEYFAKDLADFLDESRARNEFERLILVAEPRFLGKLQGSLSKPTSKCVVDTVNKEYVDLSQDELIERLGDLMLTPYKEDLVPYDRTG